MSTIFLIFKRNPIKREERANLEQKDHQERQRMVCRSKEEKKGKRGFPKQKVHKAMNAQRAVTDDFVLKQLTRNHEQGALHSFQQHEQIYSAVLPLEDTPFLLS